MAKLGIDVHYCESGSNATGPTIATAAGVIFENWEDEKPLNQLTSTCPVPSEYISGQFYKRELPCILQLLKQLNNQPDTIIVDGYVHLADGSIGLGGHLYQSLSNSIPVIGVAKNPMKDHQLAKQIMRGSSSRPLYVTAAGIDLNTAAQHISDMHGQHRHPTLLKLVDHLCRGIDS